MSRRSGPFGDRDPFDNAFFKQGHDRMSGVERNIKRYKRIAA